MMKRYIICTLAALTLAACGGRSSEEKEAARRLIDAAYRTKQYTHLLALSDSLEKTGALTTAESYYWQGYASDRLMQHRTAEFYWKSAINEVIASTDDDDLSVLAKSASYLTNELIVREDYAQALKVALPVAQRLEALQCDTTSDFTNLLIFIGCCQSHYGQSNESAIASFDHAYKMHKANIEKARSSEAYKNAIAGIINIAYNCIGIRHYDEVLTWTDRFGKLLGEYEMRNDAQTAYVDKQWMRYNIYRATALEGLGRKEEAAQAYSDYQRTAYSQTPEGKMEAAEFLVAAKHWEEAAECYQDLDKRFEENPTGFSLEDIQKMVLKKYRSNLNAGHHEAANAVARQICDSLDAAITRSRHLDAHELETINQKRAELTEEHEKSTRQRMMASMVALAIVLSCFAAYILYRRRAMHRLVKAHKQLQGAYTQVEGETSARERMESEQRMARDLQAKLLPADCLQRDEVELYATLTPSRQTSGSLYDFFIRDEKLFFCIGSAEGSGITASMAMAVVRLNFRTASVSEDLPSRIVTTINETMAGDSTTPPFTLFVGVLDLSSGRLSYCNAGHCAPVLIGSGMGLLPVEQSSALGQHHSTPFTTQEALIDPGTVIFIHTLGLTNAQNQDGKAFGQQRMMGEALQTIHGLDPSPRQFIERMTATLQRFTDNREQDDDITMVAIRYMKQADGVSYQRTITLPNDADEMLRLPTFIEEVCKAVRLNRQSTAGVIQTLKEATTSIATNAYPKGTKGTIQVEARATDKELQLVVRDYGKPFDPTATLNTQGMATMAYERLEQTAEALAAGMKSQNVLTFTLKFEV